MKSSHIAIVAALAAVQGWAGAEPNGLVVLLTDYGADSIYVGALKGAIYTKFPDARIDAITNSVPPFDIVSGAYILAEACGEFPPGTTFCCVVDPGVGTERKRIALETRCGRIFVGPDNGLLWLVASQRSAAQIREAANPSFWRDGEVSLTFHGRDVFGPVAAALARGTPIAEVGPPLADLVRLPIEQSRVEANTVRGTVVRTDVYGNCITNITEKDLVNAGFQRRDLLQVTVGDACFTAPWEGAYADVPQGHKVVLIQSAGLVELAVNLGHLAQTLGQPAHASVTITKAP